jgi:hypothetical protein
VTLARVHEKGTSMTVIIGIDPHKSTHTAVAIDRDEQPLARVQLVADRCQAGGCWPGRNRWARTGAGRSSRLRGWEVVGPAARRIW